jgi:exodeoxyribonuclease VII large subunit
MAKRDSGQHEAFGGGGGRAPSAAGEPRPLTISQAARLVRQALETSVGEVWVEGEISNWKQHPASSHCYFTLKDESAQLAAVMWRAAWMRVDFEPRNGLLVEARGTLTFYEARGQAQIAGAGTSRGRASGRALETLSRTEGKTPEGRPLRRIAQNPPAAVPAPAWAW